MSPDRFPERIDPQRIFANNASISSEIPLGSFERLQDYLSGGEGVVSVRLDFGFDDSGRRRISGELSTRVHVRCQRCLEDMPLDIDTELDVVVVSSEAEARALPAGTEAVVTDEEGLDLRAVVEDELILSLPIVPYHEDAQCNDELNRLRRAAPEEKARQESPFAKLRELKLGKAEDNAAKGAPRNPTDTD